MLHCLNTGCFLQYQQKYLPVLSNYINILIQAAVPIHKSDYK